MSRRKINRRLVVDLSLDKIIFVEKFANSAGRWVRGLSVVC